MEYNNNAVARKQIQVLVVLAFLVMAGGFVFYTLTDSVFMTLPFVAGAALGCVLNTGKVILLKRAVLKAVERDAHGARLHLQVSYFLRLMLTLAVLLVAALSPNEYVNVMGTVIVLLTWPLAMYSMKFFFRNQLVDDIMNASTKSRVDSSANAVEEIKAIVAKNESTGSETELPDSQKVD